MSNNFHFWKKKRQLIKRVTFEKKKYWPSWQVIFSLNAILKWTLITVLDTQAEKHAEVLLKWPKIICPNSGERALPEGEQQQIAWEKPRLQPCSSLLWGSSKEAPPRCTGNGLLCSRKNHFSWYREGTPRKLRAHFTRSDFKSLTHLPQQDHAL